MQSVRRRNVMHDVQEEMQPNTYHQVESENQVSEFLHCCLKLLSDPKVAKKLTHMLTRCMGEEETTIVISSPLPEWDVCPGERKKCTGREFKMTIELGSYEMDGVMLDLGSDVNIFPKQSWELMGKPNLVWSPIQLRLSNQYKIYPIGRLEQVEVNIDGVKTKVDFEVIEIMDDSDPYPTLLGID
jgi:hypothetical protein